MKQRIELKDLRVLNKQQRQNLRDLWLPARYDLAVSYFCTDAETETYNELEFTVGRVKAKLNGMINLYDMRAIDGYHKLFNTEADEIEEPIAFNKVDCLPLLTIGQMIEMMQKLNFSKYHFYILAGNGTIGCEVGNFVTNLKTKILNEGYESHELCDVLWNMIVSLL